MAPLGSLARAYGAVSVAEASRLLEDSVAGALAYDTRLIGKSSVFAAYQAHGMAIVLFAEPGKEVKPSASGWPLVAEEIFAYPAGSPALFDRLQSSADAGLEQYRRHRSVSAMAAAVLPALAEGGSGR